MSDSKELEALRPVNDTSVAAQVNDDLASYFFTLLRTARLVQAEVLAKFQAGDVSVAELHAAIQSASLDPRIVTSITAYIKAAGALSDAGDIEKAMKELKKFESELNSTRDKINANALEVAPL